MSSGETFRLAFDIGGTFTDFALLNEETGEIAIHKCLTTPHDPAAGALTGLRELLQRHGVDAGAVRNVVHGTTLVTNALIERKGAKVALLTTRGFRDTLEIRNEQRYDIYDLFLRYPEPLVPRYLRLGVEERIDHTGRVLQPVSRAAIAGALDRLRTEDARDQAAWATNGHQAPNGNRARPLTSLAIAFLHAYHNPANERQAAQHVQELWPELEVSLSSAVAPEIREYERTSTTVANAYVRPVTRDYLDHLTRALAALGYRGRLYLMLSSGGICTVETAVEFPIQLVESGPAGGAIGAAFTGEQCGLRDLVSFDMGGTTAKICHIQDGRPSISHQLEVARVERFKKGSGLPLQVASVEMMEIGAGGGSIARIDELGLLRVGPDSAGASPGPACYGLGGAEPTVTDADLVLGYLDPEYFLGGTMGLDRGAAERVISERIARPLGLAPTAAAWGIHRLVNENMAAAAKIHIIERGHDPAQTTLLAFGGAGPIHAAGVAEILHQERIVCPPAAGVLSAVGFLVAPVAFELAQSNPQLLDRMDWAAVNQMLDDLAERGRALVLEAGVPAAEIHVERKAEGRFAGQLHEIAFDLPQGTLSVDRAEELESIFNRQYRQLYGHVHPNIPIEILTWRVTARGQLTEMRVQEHPVPAAPGLPAPRTHRPVFWPQAADYVPTPIYDRYALGPTVRIDGPAIVEERESTALVPPGSTAEVDTLLNLVITRGAVPAAPAAPALVEVV